MPGVKNQHYVPRFYLKSFTDGTGFLSAVRRDTGGLNSVFRTKPENVCAENYLYEVGDARPWVKMVSSKRA